MNPFAAFLISVWLLFLGGMAHDGVPAAPTLICATALVFATYAFFHILEARDG